MVSITIDGRAYQAPEGTPLMEVAAREGLPVAGLCSSRHLRPYGSCRLCMVRVEGQRALAAACTTPAREGLVVTTDTPDIRRVRRTLLELYLSEHAAEAPRAQVPSDLHRLAADHGADPTRFRHPRYRARQAPPDDSSPFFSFDPERCILCARCLRACDEVQGQRVLHLNGRGFHTTVAVGGPSFYESACVSCGACVKECPTGALADRAVLRHGKPDRAVRTTCTYCGVGCQFHVEAAGRRIVRMQPVDESPVNAGHACVKGRYAFGYVSSPDRLLWPQVRENPRQESPARWRDVSWEEAVGLVARRFSELLKQYGPDAVACISSSRGTNEENYVMQKFARACLGNNHIDNCARVCHSATVAGMQEVLGTGAATNSLADIEQARLILMVGCNPTEGHPVTGARIKRAVRGGTRLIVIDPRRIELAGYADVHLQLRPGTNVAVLNGLAHVILTEGLADQGFIRERTENFEAYRALVESYPPERVEEISGVPADLLRRAARLYATSSASMACHGLGVTEHRTGSHGVMALANLAILTGNIGRPGTGVNPLRGQNNVQGSCDMGALPNILTASQKPDDPEVRARFEAEWGRPLPRTPGWKIPEMYEAALAGKLKALWVVGYDLAQTDPNTELVRRALSSLELLVVSDLFPNETTACADVVFPAAGGLEKEGTFTNGERRIQRVREVLPPPGEARTDWEAVCAVATAMGYPMAYAHPSEIMDEIARLTPPMRGVSYDRLEGEGLQWPVPDRAHPGTPILHTEQFPRGRAKFAPVDYVPPGSLPDDEYPFVLVTGRRLQHYNSGTMTRRTALAGVVDRDTLEMHAQDAAALGLRDGDDVAVSSATGATRLPLQVSGRVAPGNVFTTFHFPDDRVNTLFSSSADALTRCPEYKVLAVRVERAEPAG